MNATATPALLAEYYTTADEVILFLLRAEDSMPSVARIAMPIERQLTIVEEYRDSLLYDDYELPDDVAADLASLVRPVADRARETDVVLLVPHGPLHYIPLHAIDIDGMAILERHAVCYSPSASSVAQVRREVRPNFRTGLVLGDSLGDLPHGRAEARVVAGHFDTTSLEGASCTRERVFSELRKRGSGVGVLHVACHGFFDAEDALASGIHLASEPGFEESESVWSAEDVLGMMIPADLVVLSACETGLSELRPGEELFGLARAFLVAGAPAVIVSLWSVDDLATGLLFGRFYELLESGLSTNLALQQAALYVKTLTVAEANRALDVRESVLIGGADDRSSEYLDEGRAALSEFARRQAAVATGPRSRHSPGGRRPERSPADDRPHEKADLTRRPFDHPYYWAPFLLVGDWR